MKMIETKGLTKYYGKTRGIDHLDLTVEEGEMFGFIGPNGAGKSTTIRTLLGLIHPTSGSAEVLGKDICRDRQYILANVGYMMSETSFYDGMKVGDLIRYSAGLRGKNCDQEAKVLCERLQLDPGKKVNELSLGNKKKTSIVCAMQHRPPLYILDEPTSGLDPLIQKEFFELLAERRKEGATVFLSSHVLNEIQRHCGRAAIIRGGKLIACERMDALSRSRTKRVTLHGNTDILTDLLRREVEKMSCEDGTVSFLYQGEAGELLKLLSRLPIEDLTVTEPELEEIFMHYYGGGQEL
ncbi:MAG: ABC transporter ATP-binding protein [Candidatus Choladocola sp.]|nr:ABC transporter ATP-binding protein [Candidatus Choladocola sp.]